MVLIKTILHAAASMSAILAVPMPLHNTNNQRLPDHPATLDQSDYTSMIAAQKHNMCQKFWCQYYACVAGACSMRIWPSDHSKGDTKHSL
jgi:hypothetical protein